MSAVDSGVKRRILFVATFAPVRPDSGAAIRIRNLLQAYGRIGEVNLLTYAKRDESADPGALLSLCASVEAAPAENGTATSLQQPGTWNRRWRWLASTRPSLARTHFSRELQERIRAAMSSVDIIHVSHLQMVSNILSLIRQHRRRPTLILDLDDLQTVIHARLLREARGIKRRLVAAWELARVWAYERRVFSAFDRVLVCSDHDRRRLPHLNVRVVPNGATLHEPLMRTAEGRPTLFYCGLLSYGPNAWAARYLVEVILPLVRRQIADVRVKIVGKQPGPELRALDDGDAVRVHADVPSMEPYYRDATAAVVPLRNGGGTRVKILEAFAFGTPVVSTSIGCEGLDVVNQDHLLIEDDPQRFADACVTLLRDAPLRARLTANARNLVEARYSWDRIQADFAELSLAALDERRAFIARS